MTVKNGSKFLGLIILTVLAMLLSLTLPALSQEVFINDDPKTLTAEWDGKRGAENKSLDCDEEGRHWHWILTPTGGIVIQEATLTVGYKDNSTTVTEGVYSGKSEQGAFHFDVKKDDGGVVESADVTFTYTGNYPKAQPPFLTISWVECYKAPIVETGELTLRKVITDESIPDVDFEVTVSNKGNNGTYEKNFKVNPSKDPVVVDDLPVGYTYTITEKNIPPPYKLVDIDPDEIYINNKNNYNNNNYNNNNDKTEYVNLVTITNEKVETGELSLKKVMDDKSTPDVDFEVTVSNKDNEGAYEKSFKVNPSKDPFVVDDLPVGYTYTITEKNIPAPYKLVDIDPDEIYINNNDNNNNYNNNNYNNDEPEYVNLVTITNEIEEEKTGELTLRKVMDDDSTPNVDFEVTVSNKGDEGTYEKSFKVNPSKDPVVVDGLPVGYTYTITEKNIPGPYRLVSISPTTIDILNNNDTNNVVLNNESSENNNDDYVNLVTITNRRVPTNGPSPRPSNRRIIIEKELEGDITEEDEDAEFTINVKGPGMGPNGRDIKVSANNPVTLRNLGTGTYTFNEVPHRDFKFEGINPSEVTLRARVETVTVTVTNSKEFVIPPPLPIVEPELGSISVTKLEEGTGKALPGWEFTLTGDDYSSTKTTGSDGVARWDNLEPGEYTLKETLKPNWEPLDPQGGVLEITLGEEEHLRYEFTNKFIKPLDVEPEPPAVEPEPEPEPKPRPEELPYTGSNDFLRIGLGFLLATGGMLLKRRKF